jgi:hypothetical protein
MENAKGTLRTAKLIANQAKLICGPSESRIALIFSPPVSDTRAEYYTISTEPGVSLSGGINMLSSSGPVTISSAQYGDAAKRAWYAIASADMTIGYLETVLA